MTRGGGTPGRQRGQVPLRHPVTPAAAPLNSHPGEPHGLPHHHRRRTALGRREQDLARHLRPPGVGKTTLLKSLPAEETVCLDLEAGMKSVQDWRGTRSGAQLHRFPRPRRADRRARSGPASEVLVRRRVSRLAAAAVSRHRHRGFPRAEADRLRRLDHRPDAAGHGLCRQQQPEAFSERTGKPDVRGAYGLLGREVIQALKHLQHARGKT
ncbi:MAG: AAA family ATPase [Rhodobacteraceae bacterium]|nr:AAA family ATPase [Paracoccaceae bacterium]